MQKIENPKIYIDCSATVYSGLNTGIQRVVRNTIKWSTGENSQSHHLVVPVVILWGYIFEISPAIVQINRSKLILFGSQTKLRVESARARLRKKLSKYKLFGPLFVSLLHGWDRILRLSYRVLKYSRVMLFVIQSGFKIVKPGPDDVFLFLDSFWLLDLPSLFRKSLSVCRRKIAVSYDIIPLLHPDLVEEEGQRHFTRAFDYLIQKVDGVLAISKSVAEEVRQYLKDNNYGLDHLLIRHFYLGGDFKPLREIREDQIRPEVKSLLSSDQSRMWLIVGTIEPRKNHQFVLDAFDRLWSLGLEDRLVIVGRVGWKCDDVLEKLQNHPLIGQKLVYLKDSTDDELQYCYSQADALIFASYTEGFGLPLVEAMFYKIPILCSDIPVFREVGGESPVYFRLGNMDDFCEKVVHWNDSQDPKAPSSAFLTWKESARLVISRAIDDTK